MPNSLLLNLNSSTNFKICFQGRRSSAASASSFEQFVMRLNYRASPSNANESNIGNGSNVNGSNTGNGSNGESVNPSAASGAIPRTSSSSRRKSYHSSSSSLEQRDN